MAKNLPVLLNFQLQRSIGENRLPLEKKLYFLPQLKLVIGLSLKISFRHTCPDLSNYSHTNLWQFLICFSVLGPFLIKLKSQQVLVMVQLIIMTVFMLLSVLFLIVYIPEAALSIHCNICFIAEFAVSVLTHFLKSTRMCCVTVNKTEQTSIYILCQGCCQAFNVSEVFLS